MRLALVTGDVTLAATAQAYQEALHALAAAHGSTARVAVFQGEPSLEQVLPRPPHHRPYRDAGTPALTNSDHGRNRLAAGRTTYGSDSPQYGRAPCAMRLSNWAS
jgi:hypothetical protein